MVTFVLFMHQFAFFFLKVCFFKKSKFTCLLFLKYTFVYGFPDIRNFGKHIFFIYQHIHLWFLFTFDKSAMFKQKFVLEVLNNKQTKMPSNESFMNFSPT